MSRFTEKELEDFIIEKLEKEHGWKYVPAEELDRESFEDPLLTRDLVRKIKELNDVELSEEDIQNVLKALKFKTNNQEGIKAILNYLKLGVSIRLEKQKVLARIKLFDFKNIDKNDFIVTRQVHYTNGDNKIITDVMLYVNGIPLVNIECKNPASFAEDWTHAFNDVKLYEQQVPELYKYVQIGVAAAETARYFPSVMWQEYPRTEEWKVEGCKDPVECVTHMLSRHVLLDILQNFLFYRIEFGNATKVITRYMQYRAVNKIVDRVTQTTEGKLDKKNGLIWHWQGSGKTLEMIFAAYKLYHLDLLQNPSVFFIVDRTDLEEQLNDEFNALDITKPEVIESIAHLKRVIRHDNYKGKRGLMIALVHKFRPGELEEVEEELKKVQNKQETLSSRQNVISFIDEGHRTQYGQLAGQMKRILGENTFRFAFTGTPVSRPDKGADTYREFSYLPDEKYLDKYFITDSINDGFTVKISYKPALDNVKGIHLDREKLDTFLEADYEEIPENFREVTKEGVKKKLNLIKAYLENPERIAQIAKHIAEHYKKNLDGSFKAMLVAVSREACVTYKRELDKHLPPEWSEVVMSYDDKKDFKRKGIPEFKKELLKRYKGKDTDDIKKVVVNNYKEEDMPKIVIVKEMLLTGFDAPMLQTMYLDQPLKEHRLLQAIARTNRPFKGLKEAGLVIDFIGILKEFHRAFEIYNKEEIKDVLYSTEDMRKDFKEKIKEIFDLFEEIPKDKIDRKTLLKTIELLSSDENKSKKFIADYKVLRRLFELLGADVIKADMAKEYGWISQIYANYINAVYSKSGEEKMYVERYFKKTIEYIHQSTELQELDDTLLSLEFDENYITKLDEKAKSKEEKAANMVFTLNKFVLVDKHKDPVFETIGGRVEKLLKLWKQKTKSFEKIYQEGLAIWQQYMDTKKRQKELKLDNLAYKLLLRLESKFGEKAELLKDVKTLQAELKEIISLKNWANQITERKKAEKTIRTFIRKYVREYGIGLDEMEDLYKKIIDDVVKNA